MAPAPNDANAEIIHDLAPGAPIVVREHRYRSLFVQAVNYLASTNDIVVDDLGFFGDASTARASIGYYRRRR